ncbi:MAG TPA: hypothetical protein VHV50_02620 [Actinomycetota bacterium]|jgi:hypothetical protein|nr:hypothetical protein [Actinomycetota bacterium]
MRKRFAVVIGIAALGTAVLASPAFAFDRHFGVLAKGHAFHEVGQNAFVFKDKLLDPKDRSNKVGRDRFKCREKPHNRLKCHALVRLNGKIGGIGHIRVRGDIEPGDRHMVVLGGSRQFDGVAGKMTIHQSTKPEISSRYHFDLVR